MEIAGRVVKKPFAVGSKSKRLAVVIQTDDAEYVLRRMGAVAFSDSELESLVGRRIRAEGTLTGYTFLMSACTTLDKT